VASFAAATMRADSSDDTVPQGSVAGAGPVGPSTATACRYTSKVLPEPTASLTSAQVAPWNVWVTRYPVAVVPSPKSQKYFSPLLLPLLSREKAASNVTVSVESGLAGVVSKYATGPLGCDVAPR
jgi:hypothetical protein